MGKGVLTSVLTLPFFAPFILSKWLIARVKCLRRGSNSHLQFRKPSFYPLNYGDNFSSRNPNRRRLSAQYWKLARKNRSSLSNRVTQFAGTKTSLPAKQSANEAARRSTRGSSLRADSPYLVSAAYAVNASSKCADSASPLWNTKRWRNLSVSPAGSTVGASGRVLSKDFEPKGFAVNSP